MRWWFSYNEGSLCPPLLLDTFISRRLSSLWLMVIYFSHSQWPNDFQIFVLSFGQYSLRFCPHYDPWSLCVRSLNDPWSLCFRPLNDTKVTKFPTSHLCNGHYAFVLSITHDNHVFVLSKIKWSICLRLRLDTIFIMLSHFLWSMVIIFLSSQWENGYHVFVLSVTQWSLCFRPVCGTMVIMFSVSQWHNDDYVIAFSMLKGQYAFVLSMTKWLQCFSHLYGTLVYMISSSSRHTGVYAFVISRTHWSLCFCHL